MILSETETILSSLTFAIREFVSEVNNSVYPPLVTTVVVNITTNQIIWHECVCSETAVMTNGMKAGHLCSTVIVLSSRHYDR